MTKTHTHLSAATELPWWKILADNWRGRNGNTVTGDSVRNSCADELEKVAARHSHVPQAVQEPTWTEEELAHAFFEYGACSERRCGWEEPGICDCRNDARRAVHVIKHVLPRSFPLASSQVTRPDRGGHD
jgi:hypothetical protein